MFAVAFALEGTLIRVPALERTAFARLCEEVARRGGSAVDADAMERALRRNSAAFADGGPQLNASIVESVRDATRVSGSEKALSARYRQIAGQVATELAQPAPGATAMLRQLKNHAVPMAILTNGLSSAEQSKAHSLSFDGPVVISENTGVKKPDIRAFGALLDAMRMPAECVWYLAADFEYDIRPARTAGINAVWLNENGGSDTVRNFDEFMELIKGPYTRSLLNLRYIMHTALAWRPGHFVPGEEYGLGE